MILSYTLIILSNFEIIDNDVTKYYLNVLNKALVISYYN